MWQSHDLINITNFINQSLSHLERFKKPTVFRSFLLNFGENPKQYITNLIADLNQLLANNVEPTKIKTGGPDIIVEIGECKMSKRNEKS